MLLGAELTVGGVMVGISEGCWEILGTDEGPTDGDSEELGATLGARDTVGCPLGV